MEIFQVKTKERLTAELSYIHTYPKDAENEDPRQDKVTGHECKHIMHDDFLTKLDALRIFLVDICEFEKYKALEKDEDLLIPFEVTGITVAGEGAARGVTLIGRKNLNEGRVLNLVAPFVKFDKDTSHYPKALALETAVLEFLDEASEYMNGKKRPTAQLELFSDGEEGEGGVESLEGVKLTVQK